MLIKGPIAVSRKCGTSLTHLKRNYDGWQSIMCNSRIQWKIQELANFHVVFEERMLLQEHHPKEGGCCWGCGLYQYLSVDSNRVLKLQRPFRNTTLESVFPSVLYLQAHSTWSLGTRGPTCLWAMVFIAELLHMIPEDYIQLSSEVDRVQYGPFNAEYVYSSGCLNMKFALFKYQTEL